MDAIIVDMDGTLCDVSPIRHYVTGERRDFYSFHEASRFMATIPEVEAAVRDAAQQGIAVLIVTARDARFERATRDFLFRHQIPYTTLFMRPWGDQRRDSLVKSDILASILEAGYRPIHAYDDREDIAQVWESAGIPTTLIASDDAPGRIDMPEVPPLLAHALQRLEDAEREGVSDPIAEKIVRRLQARGVGQD